jgi:hypothetical protein
MNKPHWIIVIKYTEKKMSGTATRLGTVGGLFPSYEEADDFLDHYLRVTSGIIEYEICEIQA